MKVFDKQKEFKRRNRKEKYRKEQNRYINKLSVKFSSTWKKLAAKQQGEVGVVVYVEQEPGLMLGVVPTTEPEAKAVQTLQRLRVDVRGELTGVYEAISLILGKSQHEKAKSEDTEEIIKFLSEEDKIFSIYLEGAQRYNTSIKEVQVENRDDNTATESTIVYIDECSDEYVCCKCGNVSNFTQAVLFVAISNAEHTCGKCGERGKFVKEQVEEAQPSIIHHLFEPRIMHKHYNKYEQSILDHIESTETQPYILINVKTGKNRCDVETGSNNILEALKSRAQSVVTVVESGSNAELMNSHIVSDGENSEIVEKLGKASLQEPIDASIADSNAVNIRTDVLDDGEHTVGMKWRDSGMRVVATGAGVDKGVGKLKKKEKMNHLLNFSLPPRIEDTSRPLPIRRKNNKVYGSESYNREIFVRANYRFVLKATPDMVKKLEKGFSYKKLEWSEIDQVVVAMPVYCPICLELPTAPRMTDCGHIYCLACILRLFTEISSHKCPVCWCILDPSELKRAKILEISNSPEAGSAIEMRLMKRDAGGKFVFPYESSFWPVFENNKGVIPYIGYDEGAIEFSKYMFCGREIQRYDLEREIGDLTDLARDEIFDSVTRKYLEIAIQSVVEEKKQMELNDFQLFHESKYHNMLTRFCNPRLEKLDNENLFYQSVDGQYIYLSTLDLRVLKAEYSSSASQDQHQDLVQHQDQDQNKGQDEGKPKDKNKNKGKSKGQEQGQEQPDGDSRNESTNIRHTKVHTNKQSSQSPTYPLNVRFEITYLTQMTMSSEFSQKNKLYDFIPERCDIKIVEADLNRLASNDTLRIFEKQLTNRKLLRKRIDKRENAEHKRINTKLENEERMEKMALKMSRHQGVGHPFHPLHLHHRHYNYDQYDSLSLSGPPTDSVTSELLRQVGVGALQSEFPTLHNDTLPSLQDNTDYDADKKSNSSNTRAGVSAGVGAGASAGVVVNTNLNLGASIDGVWGSGKNNSAKYKNILISTNNYGGYGGSGESSKNNSLFLDMEQVYKKLSNNGKAKQMGASNQKNKNKNGGDNTSSNVEPGSTGSVSHGPSRKKNVVKLSVAGSSKFTRR